MAAAKETTTIERQKARRPIRPIDDKLRKRIERAVERLISALDALDAPAEDLDDAGEAEDGGDTEPSLGSLGSYGSGSQEGWAAGDCRDGEREPNMDDEPSLAAPIDIDQRNWTNGGDDDREDDRVDEPSLGATENVDQRIGWRIRYGDVSPRLADREDIPLKARKATTSGSSIRSSSASATPTGSPVWPEAPGSAISPARAISIFECSRHLEKP